MKYAITILSLIGFLVIQSAFVAVDGAETRDVDDFTKLSVSGSVVATLVASNETKVEIKTENAEPEDVLTKMKGEKLIIRFKNNNSWGSKRKAYVTVYYKTLQSLGASAGAKIKADRDLESKAMDVDVSSGGTIKVGIQCTNLHVDVSSGGRAQLEGKCVEQRVDVSSGGSYRGEEVESEDATISASSGGSAKVWVTKNIDASASSGGSIKYKGNPAVRDIDAGYSGSVKKM